MCSARHRRCDEGGGQQHLLDLTARKVVGGDLLGHLAGLTLTLLESLSDSLLKRIGKENAGDAAENLEDFLSRDQKRGVVRE